MGGGGGCKRGRVDGGGGCELGFAQTRVRTCAWRSMHEAFEGHMCLSCASMHGKPQAQGPFASSEVRARAHAHGW